MTDKLKAIYMHSSMFGSYWVDCKILAEREWNEEYMSLIEKSFGKHTDTSKQYLISYFDGYSEEHCEKWVDDNFVEIFELQIN